MKIHQLKLRISNAYLILGEQPILVDTGAPNDIETIRSKLNAFGVKFSDIALIIHTHVHSDHMGSTAQIVAEANCPIAYHPSDQGIIQRSHNGKLKGIGLRGRIMSQFLSDVTFKSLNADIELYDNMTLNNYGVDATILSTPGHTPGSVSIIALNGDAIIGDVIMGGFVGGNLFPNKPNYHYFAEDVHQTMNSLDLILSKTSATLFVGHGGPLSHQSVYKWRQKQQK